MILLEGHSRADPFYFPAVHVGADVYAVVDGGAGLYTVACVGAAFIPLLSVGAALSLLLGSVLSFILLVDRRCPLSCYLRERRS